MTTKNWMLVALTVMLGAFSLYLNRDWFARDNIQIMHRSRPSRGAFRQARNNPLIDPISFWFDRKVKLTSLEVVPLSGSETNKHPQPIWHLVSESNSVPIQEFTYGMRIGGMHPALKGSSPFPLEPGVTYRMFVQAGRKRAEHDFIPQPRTD